MEFAEPDRPWKGGSALAEGMRESGLALDGLRGSNVEKSDGPDRTSLSSEGTRKKPVPPSVLAIAEEALGGTTTEDCKCGTNPGETLRFFFGVVLPFSFLSFPSLRTTDANGFPFG